MFPEVSRRFGGTNEMVDQEWAWGLIPFRTSSGTSQDLLPEKNYSQDNASRALRLVSRSGCALESLSGLRAIF